MSNAVCENSGKQKNEAETHLSLRAGKDGVCSNLGKQGCLILLRFMSALLRLEHLKIEVLPLQDQGGQRVGVNPPHIRVTHLPTGLLAECSTERSQLRCLNVCKAMIEYGLIEIGWNG